MSTKTQTVTIKGWELSISVDENQQIVVASTHKDGMKVLDTKIDMDGTVHLEASAYVCDQCGNNLMDENAVTRTYTPKDEENEEIACLGQYLYEGTFDTNNSVSFGGESYDCHENSDICTCCNAQL